MAELFREAYYYLDLLVGFLSPLIFYFLYRTGRIKKFIWHFFWIGFFVGLLWEIPIFVMSGETSIPLVVWNRPFPCHYLVFMISHSLWDGLLFITGIYFVKFLCKSPYFMGFKAGEFSVLFVWGQVSELCVEISSTLNDGWSFVEYWWNPVIFTLNTHDIAWLMQIIWAFAVVLYYFILLWLRPRYDWD